MSDSSSNRRYRLVRRQETREISSTEAREEIVVSVDPPAIMMELSAWWT